MTTETTQQSEHTPPPYSRIGCTLFALQDWNGRKCNRFTAHVQRGPGCSEAEAESVAALFQDAVNERPDLLARIKRLEAVAKMVDAWGNGLRHPTEHEAKMVKTARAALTE